jgi:hypothetical protein
MSTSFLKSNQIIIGSKWKRIDGSDQIVTIDDIKNYPASDHELNNWSIVHYSWGIGKDVVTNHSDHLSFQCRYCPL